MRLLQGPLFEDLFRRFEHTAFHLEVDDTYDTPEESEPFRKFLAGEPDDFAWHRAWLDLVRETTKSGRSVERVRVVSVPHVDYTRWGLTVAPLNIAAGEDIRWLPRDRLDGSDITADDFWLFDRSRVVFTVFTPDGAFCGGAETRDPAIVQRCVRVRDDLWTRAIPHSDYADR
ncbi:hypothetical protein EV385_0918 [Krasilnikovia cinnamomea]|uniref:DUF6879 domain-containing protein n=1 Tax=Krasilnikovia cinnamomea TaxID=349313 RepID=A0A4Q7ZEL5_9ACTN|nr:DUF6879 family protein [Krasilnikovia cinnamomea]RZU49182.1 hypothetical protein EV385_0918 [Krasilnikovia cinnamomea]